MPGFAVTHQTAAGTDLGLINIVGAADLRLKIYDLLIGSDATPADQAGEFVLNRSTAAGVGGSALFEVEIDPIGAAAVGVGDGGTYATTQPADTANTELLMIGLHQRATFRWVAAPGGELISIALANNGMFLRSVGHGATPNVNATIHWRE